MVDDLEFGNALVARGWLSEDELREAIWERQRLERLGQTAPFLWDILMERGNLSRVQVDEVLGSMQKRKRYCEACKIAVPVPRVTHEGERCVHCGGPISWKSATQIGHETMTLLARDVPQEVVIARADAARVLGKYVLVEEAGHGGVGVVYKAWDMVIGQYVALKLLRDLKGTGGMSREDLIKDLVKEARNAIRLRHPNIVPVFDAGRFGEQFFICMEYIEGDSLSAHLRAAVSRGRLSPLYEDPVHYLEIMRDVSEAVHYAHTFPKPIIHCDLKPGNVLIDTRGRPYLVDFGLAQPADLPDGATGQRHVRGTPAYMAPEQLGGKIDEFGPWTDLYAIGAILFELMTGRQVFQGSAYEIMMKAMNDAPPSPLEILAKSDETKHEETSIVLMQATKLEAVCLRCLQKDPAKRPQSGADVANELDRVIAALRSRRAAVQQGVVPPAIARAQTEADDRRVDDHITKLDLEPVFQEMGEVEEAWDARPDTLALDKLRQAKCVEAWRDRLIGRLNVQRPKVAKLELIEGTLKDAEILRATRKMIVAFVRGQTVQVIWQAIPPLVLVSLAADLLKMTDLPEDRLGVGIYCITSGLREVGRQFMSTLAGTKFEAGAKVFLTRYPAP